MRRIAAVSLAAVATSLLFGAAPASATCMEREDKYTGIRSGSCSPPGGPVSSYVCYRDVYCIYH